MQQSVSRDTGHGRPPEPAPSPRRDRHLLEAVATGSILLAKILVVCVVTEVVWGGGGETVRSLAAGDGDAPSRLLGVAAIAPKRVDTGAPARAATTILARPLFTEGRRPLPVLANGPAPEPESAALRLVGTVVGADTRSALVDQKGRQLAMPVGGSLGVWRVADIEPGRVLLLASDGRQSYLTLPSSKGEPNEPAKPQLPPMIARFLPGGAIPRP